MIAALKTNLWVTRTAQIVRLSLSNGMTGTTEFIHRSALDKGGNKPVEELPFVAPQCNKYKAFRPFTNTSFYDYVRILSNQKVTERPGGLDRELVNQVRTYIGDQIKYYKKMAKINNSAVKRIEKLKKKWEKHCDKDYE